MSDNVADNVVDWLAEVRSLQQQVSTLQQEREQAYRSVENWRKLYEGEAQQRRRDVAESHRKIQQLQQALAEVQPADPSTESNSNPQLDAEIATIEKIQSVKALQAQLIATRKQYEQLKENLQEEQQAHEQTRESLTAALSDTVDLLAKERTAGTQQH